MTARVILASVVALWIAGCASSGTSDLTGEDIVAPKDAQASAPASAPADGVAAKEKAIPGEKSEKDQKAQGAKAEGEKAEKADKTDAKVASPTTPPAPTASIVPGKPGVTPSSPKQPDPTTPGEKIAPEPEPTREPGSLWSERSSWNRIFSYRTFRKAGDTVTIRPTETLRGKISERLFETLESDRQLSTSFDDKQMVATIRDVSADGLYKIVANQVVRVGQQYQEVNVEGKVREKDISPDDSVLSDFIHEMKLELPNRAKTAQPSGANAMIASGVAQTGVQVAAQKEKKPEQLVASLDEKREVKGTDEKDPGKREAPKVKRITKADRSKKEKKDDDD